MCKSMLAFFILFLRQMHIFFNFISILVFIFFISVFSLTLAEQGTMNTNKITNKQNIVVDITFFYILVFAISGEKYR